METAFLSIKGQFVTPEAIRDGAKVAPGPLLEVRYVEREIRLRAVPSVLTAALEVVAGRLAEPNRKALSDTRTHRTRAWPPAKQKFNQRPKLLKVLE